MPLSDTILSIVAFRLAAAVMIGVVGTVLPTHSNHAPQSASCAIMAAAASPSASMDREAVGEMLSHD